MVKYQSFTQEELKQIKSKGYRILVKDTLGKPMNIDIEISCVSLTIKKVNNLYVVASHNCDTLELDVWTFDSMFGLLSEIDYLLEDIK